MLTIISNILFLLISIGMYIGAPIRYSGAFCTAILVLYLVQNTIYFLSRKRTHWFGFELFFAISFLFVNFIFPVVIYPVDPHWSLFYLPYKSAVISRATALAWMAYSFYLVGTTRLFRMQREEPQEVEWRISVDEYLLMTGLTLLSFVGFALTGGMDALRSAYTQGHNIETIGVYSYFNCLFCIGCYLMATFVFHLKRQKWWFYVGLLLIIALIIVSTGSRKLAMYIVIMLAVGFSLHIYRFKAWQVAVMLCAGAFLLYIVMAIRKEGVMESDSTQLAGMKITRAVNIFEDLIINNINLYVLVDYADHHALTFFHGVLMDITSPIPGLSSKVMTLYHEPKEMLIGGGLPSYLLLGENPTWGIGTNMVGEAYRSFGAVGMALIMGLIGWGVKEFFYGGKKNCYLYLLYFLFTAHAVMYPRAPIFFDPRTVLWSLLILWIIRSAYQRKEVKE